MNDARPKARIAGLQMRAAHEYALCEGFEAIGMFRAADLHRARGDRATFNVAELVNRLERIRRYDEGNKGTILDVTA